MRLFARTLILIPLFCLPACTRVVVKQNPGKHDKGIRFYRPKPYLMILPSEGAGSPPSISATTNIKQNEPIQLKLTDKNGQTATPTNGLQLVNYQEQADAPPMPAPPVTPPPAPKPAPSTTPGQEQQLTKVSLSMMYLPDFAEEYSIRLAPGLGIGELNIQLDNGWNLKSVGIKTDQQTDEIITSVAKLVDSFGNAIKRAEGVSNTPTTYASNVPFGLYEAIIAEDPCGRKQLYGWRYIGFTPFNSCPVKACGEQPFHCEMDQDSIYGLVFKNGRLVFEKMGTIADIDTKTFEAKTNN